MDVMKLVREEMEECQEEYGDFTSSHEALGVITEEYQELLTAVRLNYPGDISREAVQVAAACLRLAAQCEASLWTLSDDEDAFGKRSGF